ncbi:MAG: hypothetical protein JO316_13730 [Abitibacteriaceae bacterium]|nr:hypothetical protein [Abditibacteriaceae bacterium]MBV9866408.1 hypothetical protein [Abditibacteriaceae bacterium]
MSSERNGTTQPTGNETSNPASENSQNTSATGNNRVSGTTGTGIASGETGYGESGQLLDPVSPPIVKADA